MEYVIAGIVFIVLQHLDLCHLHLLCSTVSAHVYNTIYFININVLEIKSVRATVNCLTDKNSTLAKHKSIFALIKKQYRLKINMFNSYTKTQKDVNI